ncbi:uncharacterized protein LOC133346884 [Lethenteron reissneri]|uniref:uncharacterized protein LOC133346884 n=1 Tax=Lethenteron reissneri TaxID=7753 RepID=UPI002AB7A1C0|nr:uncharacterized protein LOC133346884 [Lethenteron reissneri]
MASETSDGLTAARPPCRPGSRAIGEAPDRVEVGEIGAVTRGERAPEQAQKLESNADSSATHGERRLNPRVEEFLLPGLDNKPEVSQVWQIEMQQAQPILPNGYHLEVKLLIVKTEVTSDISDCSYEIHNWVVLLTKVETAAKYNGEGDTISTTNRDVQVIVTVKDNKVDRAVTIKHPLKGGVRLANADQNTTDVGAEDVDVVTGVFPPGFGRGTGTEKTEQLENPLTFPKMETETNHNKLTEAPVNGSTLAERNSRSAIKAANEAAGEVHESAREIPKALQAVPSNASEKATASDAAEGTGSRAPQLGGAESAPLLSSTSPEQRRRAVRREQVVKTAIAPPPSTAGRGGPPVQNGDRAKPRRNTQPKYEDVTNEGPKLNAGAHRAEATAPAAENVTPEGKSSKDDIKDVCIGILHRVDDTNVGSKQSIAAGARGADQESNWGAIEVAESGTPASKVTQRSKPTVAVEEASPACGGVPNKASHTSSEGTHRRDGEKALGVLESKDKIGVPKTGEIKESAEQNCNNVMRTDDDAMERRSFDESKQMENGSISISPESPPFKTPKQSTTMQSGVQVALPELAPKQDVAQGSDEVKTDKRVPLLSNTTLTETKGNIWSEEAISEATTDVSAHGITPADVHCRDTEAKPKKGFFSIFSFEKEKKSRQTAATNAANNKPNSTSKNECSAATAAERNAELMAIKPDEDVHGTAGKGLNSVDFTDTQQNSCHPGVPLEAANTLASSAGGPAFSTDIPTQKSHEDSIDTAKEREENAKVTSDNVKRPLLMVLQLKKRALED